MNYYQETLAARLARLLGELSEHDEFYDALRKYGTLEQELYLLSSPDAIGPRQLLLHSIEATYKDCEDVGFGDEMLDLVIPHWEQLLDEQRLCAQP